MYWDFQQNVLYVSIDEFKLYYVMLERSVNEGSQCKHCIIVLTHLQEIILIE